jgi:hypothetical protein
MMRQLFVFLSLAACGCGQHIGKTLEPVEITGVVTVNQVPVSDVILNLQPTGAGTLPVVIPIKDGKFESTASPGRYAWFFEASSAGKHSRAIEAIPDEYRNADMERQIDVVDGSELELMLD